MFYNEKIFTPEPSFGPISKVDDECVEVYAKQTRPPFAPYPDKETALNSGWSGYLRWWENGEMYEASHVAANQYKPLSGIQCMPGINWDTWVACDPDELMAHVKTKYTTLWGDTEPHYNEKLGIWSIQVHYDGCCR